MMMTTASTSVTPAHDQMVGRSRLLWFPLDEVGQPIFTDLPVELNTYEDALAVPLSEFNGVRLGAVYDKYGQLVKDTERTKPDREWAGNPGHLLEPPKETPVRVLGRTFFGGHFRAAFGHVLVETLPRFWPELDYKEFNHILWYHTRPQRTRLKPHFPRYARELLRALGVRPARSVTAVQPLQFDELVVPTSAFWLKQGSSQVCAAPFQRIGDALDSAHRLDPLPTDARRIYFSRSRLQPELRRALNEDAIEDLMRRADFAVIHPQEHPIHTQVRLARQAEAISGCDGSALHLAAFARPGTTLLAIDARAVRNQFIVNEFSRLDALHVFAMDDAIKDRTQDWVADLDRVGEALGIAGLT